MRNYKFATLQRNIGRDILSPLISRRKIPTTMPHAMYRSKQTFLENCMDAMTDWSLQSPDQNVIGKLGAILKNLLQEESEEH